MRLAVIGGGAWGTALANAAALAGQEVALWLRDERSAAEMARTRENASYLPGVRLHPAVRPTVDVRALADAEAALLVVPAQATRATAERFAEVLPAGAPLIVCAKGIERETGLFLSDAVAAVRPAGPVAVLSGPSFAADVARGLPTAVALASRDEEVARRLAGALTGPAIRVYHGRDVRGVEIGGAAKNVLAIACGAVIGRGFGESAKAALMARGFAELMRFAGAYGGEPQTLMGLSGLGDLALTCSSAQSRNFAFGERLGQGLPPEAATGGKLAEGAHTASVLVTLAEAKGVDMPVAAAVAAVLVGRLTIDGALDRLMNRPIKAEY